MTAIIKKPAPKKASCSRKATRPTTRRSLPFTRHLETLEKSIQDEIGSLKESLKTKLELLDRQIKRMEGMFQDRGDTLLHLPHKENRYNQAKENYEQARAMLREMKIKQQESRTLLKISRDPVTLHEAAQ